MAQCVSLQYGLMRNKKVYPCHQTTLRWLSNILLLLILQDLSRILHCRTLLIPCSKLLKKILVVDLRRFCKKAFSMPRVYFFFHQTVSSFHAVHFVIDEMDDWSWGKSFEKVHLPARLTLCWLNMLLPTLPSSATGSTYE